MNEKKAKVVIGTLFVIIVLGVLLFLFPKNDNDSSKIESGTLTETLQQFSITQEQFDESDTLSKAIFSRITCEFQNTVYSESTGTTDVIISYPDIRTILNESMKAVEENPEMVDANYSGENGIEKLEQYIQFCIGEAKLSEKKLSVQLEYQNGQWTVVMDEELSNVLTGYIEEAYLELFNNMEG